MGRNSPNLYELLKAAGSRPPAAEDGREAPAPAAAVADSPPPIKLEPAAPVERPEPPPPKPAARAVETPKPAPSPSSPAHARGTGLGERVLAVTCNTAAFMGLVVVGVVFLAYAIGVRVGRSAAVAAQPAPPPTNVLAPLPEEPPPVYTIRLMEWSFRSSRERADAQANAVKLKAALDARQLGGAEHRQNGDRYVLNFGRFTDASSPEAKEKLSQLREFRLQRTQDPVFRGAGFVRAE